MWEQGRRLNPLFLIMSQTSYHILYPATNWSECPFEGNLTQECARAILHYIRIKFSIRIDFPTSTAYDFHKRNLLYCLYHLTLSPPPLFFLASCCFCRSTLVLFWRREKAHRRFIKGMLS